MLRPPTSQDGFLLRKMVFLSRMMTQNIVDISMVYAQCVVLLRILRPYINIILHSNFYNKESPSTCRSQSSYLALTKKKLIGIKLAFFLLSVEKNAEFLSLASPT